jgi:hypothetical protein
MSGAEIDQGRDARDRRGVVRAERGAKEWKIGRNGCV